MKNPPLLEVLLAVILLGTANLYMRHSSVQNADGIRGFITVAIVGLGVILAPRIKRSLREDEVRSTMDGVTSDSFEPASVEAQTFDKSA